MFSAHKSVRLAALASMIVVAGLAGSAIAAPIDTTTVSFGGTNASLAQLYIQTGGSSTQLNNTVSTPLTTWTSSNTFSQNLNTTVAQMNLLGVDGLRSTQTVTFDRQGDSIHLTGRTTLHLDVPVPVQTARLMQALNKLPITVNIAGAQANDLRTQFTSRISGPGYPIDTAPFGGLTTGLAYLSAADGQLSQNGSPLGELDAGRIVKSGFASGATVFNTTSSPIAPGATVLDSLDDVFTFKSAADGGTTLVINTGYSFRGNTPANANGSDILSYAQTVGDWSLDWDLTISQPVPAPSAVALLSLGGMAVARRRRSC